MLRLKKSLSEKIYLLSATQVSALEWSFKVRGQSNNVYDQMLSTTTFSCSCPDHKSRATFCKHLLFLVARVAMQMELAGKLQHNKANWKDTAFAACVASWINRLKNRMSSDGDKGKPVEKVDGDCSICFEIIANLENPNLSDNDPNIFPFTNFVLSFEIKPSF